MKPFIPTPPEYVRDDRYEDKLTVLPGRVQLDCTQGRYNFDPADLKSLRPHNKHKDRTCIILRDRKVFVVSIPLDEVREAFDAATESEVDHG